MYGIREKLAYSKLGKFLAIKIQSKMYKKARYHWIQQAFADWNFSQLKNYR